MDLLRIRVGTKPQPRPVLSADVPDEQPPRAAFERIAKRRGRNIAKVAVARRMLTPCYYGLRDGQIHCLKAPGRRARVPSRRRSERPSTT